MLLLYQRGEQKVGSPLFLTLLSQQSALYSYLVHTLGLRVTEVLYSNSTPEVTPFPILVPGRKGRLEYQLYNVYCEQVHI
jgi:hypothetical protein